MSSETAERGLKGRLLPHFLSWDLNKVKQDMYTCLCILCLLLCMLYCFAAF